ncbi:predicted protein [Arabidopsis lyrata subsp. lyrata]|uniref:Predicted protein n=1 Tax=Arabidopsis lyrata subsp. lyrata TaxID=81972 RepID=D7KB58_ARALL|nr:predicted protein [Arabidopsis lyrata subsp. lyrata]
MDPGTSILLKQSLFNTQCCGCRGNNNIFVQWFNHSRYYRRLPKLFLDKLCDLKFEYSQIHDILFVYLKPKTGTFYKSSHRSRRLAIHVGSRKLQMLDHKTIRKLDIFCFSDQ